MPDIHPGPVLEARGRERPDHTVFSFPAANVSDAASEEIEIDQALSLQGRRGRDFLGVNAIGQLLEAMVAEHLTIGTSDHEMTARFRIATRTGQFEPDDPELIWDFRVSQSVTAPTTATSEAFNPVTDGGNKMMGEPFLYVAPRIFWRFDNSLDATINADALNVRWGSVSVNLTFPIFIELLERFADVTLL